MTLIAFILWLLVRDSGHPLAWILPGAVLDLLWLVPFFVSMQ